MLLCKEKIKRVLLINLKYLGDLVVCSPVFYSLRSYFNQAEIDIIVRAGYKSLFDFDKNIDKVIEFDLIEQRKKSGIKRIASEINFIRNIRKKKYDLVITFHPTDRLALWSFVSGAKYRVGFKDQSFGYLFNIQINIKEESVNYLDYYLETLKVINIPILSYKTYVNTNDILRSEVNTFFKNNLLENQKKIIGIHPGASIKEKIWNIDNYIELIKLLLKDGIKILLFYGLNDLFLVDRIKEKINDDFLYIIDTSRSIPLLIAFLEKCDLIVCNDSFVSHLAAALNKSTITLISRNKLHCWKIYDKPNYVYIYGEPCNECKHGVCSGYECLQRIKFKTVYENIIEILNVN